VVATAWDEQMGGEGKAGRGQKRSCVGDEEGEGSTGCGAHVRARKERGRDPQAVPRNSPRHTKREARTHSDRPEVGVRRSWGGSGTGQSECSSDGGAAVVRAT